jgi:MFS family permease
VSIAIALFGFATGPMFGSGDKMLVTAYMALGLALMGITYGPLGTMLSELFPAQVRYTGASLAFNLAGIFGASLAPMIAVKLANDRGLPYVGYYLSAAAMLTVLGTFFTHETK